MTLPFTFSGQTRTLGKHPEVRLALTSGTIPEAEARRRPWYLRIGAQSFRLDPRDKVAIQQARDILRGRQTRPTDWAAFLAARDASKSITIGQLAREWYAAGLPHSKIEPRTPDQAARLRSTMDRCLPWWAANHVAAITPSTHADYIAHRQQHHARGTGDTIADRELAALSSLCQWAMRVGRIPANPFSNRTPRKREISHCHQHMPAGAGPLHRVLAWFFDSEDDQQVIAGGRLMFSALTGLRLNETSALLRLPPLAETPADLKTLPPGSIFPARDNTRRMKVCRSKRGQNPFVLLHPALEQFLSAWRAWHAQHVPGEPKLFPYSRTQTSINHMLRRASRALELPEYRPHAMRAYYSRVLRSQGSDDATIAASLGQTTRGAMIRSVYGDPEDMLGGAIFDWIPAPPQRPAWELLTRTAQIGDTSGDTSATPQQTTPNHTKQQGSAGVESGLPIVEAVEAQRQTA